MTFYVLQQWWVVAGIVDQPPTSGVNVPPMQMVADAGMGSPQGRIDESSGSLNQEGRSGNSISQQPYHHMQQQHSGTIHGESSHGMAHIPQTMSSSPGQDASDASLSMGSMASSLPNFRSSQGYPMNHAGQRLASGTLPPHQVHQQNQHPMAQYPGGHGMNTAGTPSGYPPHYMPTMHNPQAGPIGTSPPYLLHQTSHAQRGGMSNSPQQPFVAQSFVPGQQSHSSQYMYFSPVYGNIGPTQGFQGPPRHLESNTVSASPGYLPTGAGGMHVLQGHGQVIAGRPMVNAETLRRPNTTSTPGSIPAAPRGPPRKPKQSGHALWVGNLPPGANVSNLKDHFSRDATRDIESVFLISKSNCAFVNYRSEEACAAAMTRFHESRFQGVRLVCRLRRTPSTTASPGVPTGPAALSPSAPQSQTAVEAISQNREVSSRAEETMRQLDGANKINDKYFVVKSLTLEDLELSARNGIWATQSHNEAALNKAFESVDNVYLIFSANKSGEYFGYARMVSPINEESAKDLEWKPRSEVVIDDSDLPRAIPTLATDTAPKGRIIDDSARGTIFWEADALDQVDGSPRIGDKSSDEEPEDGRAGPDDEDQTPEVQAFGKPFKIEWVSTNRLPFYRTRGLRNPWNANREVKIARDGTELETSVGRRLIEMFHRSAPPPSSQQPLSPGGPAPMGYSNIRPY